VWLVGMMGAGKSTVGPALAQRLGRAFVDSDAEIERRAGRRIAEIFASEGEGGFREHERAAIDSLSGSDSVVALGGGAIAERGAAERLRRAGVVVYLNARPDTLLGRLGDCATRPLLSDVAPERRLEKLREILRARRGAYESARVVVDTDGRSAAEVVETVLKAVTEALP
jgi:shikimate kinase